ncbi:MAG: hypothetical protein WC860_02415 [Candidatus Margulisiibacteriota bacterium]
MQTSPISTLNVFKTAIGSKFQVEDTHDGGCLIMIDYSLSAEGELRNLQESLLSINDTSYFNGTPRNVGEIYLGPSNKLVFPVANYHEFTKYFQGERKIVSQGRLNRFEVLNPPADGNCFFYAIDSLSHPTTQLLSSTTAVHNLREKVLAQELEILQNNPTLRDSYAESRTAAFIADPKSMPKTSLRFEQEASNYQVLLELRNLFSSQNITPNDLASHKYKRLISLIKGNNPKADVKTVLIELQKYYKEHQSISFDQKLGTEAKTLISKFLIYFNNPPRLVIADLAQKRTEIRSLIKSYFETNLTHVLKQEANSNMFADDQKIFALACKLYQENGKKIVVHNGTEITCFPSAQVCSQLDVHLPLIFPEADLERTEYMSDLTSEDLAGPTFLHVDLVGNHYHALRQLP